MAAVPERAGAVLAGSALAVVGVSVVLFAGLGGVLGDDDAPADTPVAAPGDEEPATDEDVASPTPQDAEAEPTPSESAEDEPDPEPDPEPSEEPSTEPSTEPFEPTIDPSTVSVQVLDGDGVEGRAETEAVAERLREAGYNVVVVNDASRTYEETTVFWTAGFETQGREMAQLFGFPEAAPKVDNLSDQVQVHLVVGADQA